MFEAPPSPVLSSLAMLTLATIEPGLMIGLALVFIHPRVTVSVLVTVSTESTRNSSMFAT